MLGLRLCLVCSTALGKGRRKYCDRDCLISARRSSTIGRWWNPDEDLVLRTMYMEHVASAEIAAKLGRSLDSVYMRSRALGLQRDNVPMSPFGSLARLLEDTPEAAYWVGFVAADGSLEDRGRLKVTLATKDRNHLERLSEFLEASLSITEEKDGRACTIALMDSSNAAALRRKFDLRSAKTYSPPSVLPFDSDDLLRAFLVGFVDGDGYIRKQTGRRASTISTVSHMSWTPFLEELSHKLAFGRVHERPGGEGSTGRYVALSSFRHNDNVGLKRFAVDRRLPILARKWDRIDESLRITKSENAKILRDMVQDGCSVKQIMEKVGCSQSRVYQVRYELKKRAEVSDHPHTSRS